MKRMAVRTKPAGGKEMHIDADHHRLAHSSVNWGAVTPQPAGLSNLASIVAETAKTNGRRIGFVVFVWLAWSNALHQEARPHRSSRTERPAAAITGVADA
jgi:hypothetical protein